MPTNNEVIIDNIYLANEQQMLELGSALAQTLADDRLLVFLNGDLGAGKTTLVRGFLNQCGYHGAVKSPTFTLVEPYTVTANNLQQHSIFHFDLYRLADAQELDYMGMSDYLDGLSTVFVEWPEKGAGYLPVADLQIDIAYQLPGRLLSLTPGTARGRNFLCRLRLLLQAKDIWAKE